MIVIVVMIWCLKVEVGFLSIGRDAWLDTFVEMVIGVSE